MKDYLTGLDRYGIFLKKLEQAIKDMGDGRIAVIYTDIKHFKYINDTYGYQVGNSLLREFAQAGNDDNDNKVGCARIYSDNFVTAMKVPDGVSNEDFRNGVEQVNIKRGNVFKEKYLNSRLQFCTGICIVDKNSRGKDVETIVSNANLARKMAKESDGRGCILFDDSMLEGIRREVEVTSSIPKAITNKEFKVYYQPKIDTYTRKLVGAEALVRWEKPDGTMICPDEFIPLAECSGQVTDIDFYVYREVFEFLADRIREGKKVVPISVNVSRVHLSRNCIVDYINSLFEEYKIPHNLIEYELTESIYLEDTKNALDLINQLHEAGSKVSMDDFGSGYSSLNLLSKLPIDVIKLDKVFLKADMEESDKVIISCIVDMASKLGITSLCEGVETSEQSRFLKDIKCQIQQGYFFAKPIPRPDFERFMAAY